MTIFAFLTSPLSADTTTGLVGWWKLDEGSGGTTADSSGNGYTGTLYNSPSWGTGYKNYALTFNGSTQYVDVTGFSNSTIFSYSAWVYTTAANGNIFEERINGFDKAMYIQANVPFFGFWNGSSPSTCSGGTVSNNVWTHVAGTWDGTNCKLYINGALVASSTPGGSASDGGIFWKAIGLADSGGGWAGGLDSYFTGTIDDVRVFNRALSATDVMEVYSGFMPIRIGNNAYIANITY